MSFAFAPRRPLGLALLLLLITAATFRALPSQEFTAWDDGIHVYQNPHLNPVTPQSAGFFWTHAYNKLYMPLTYSTYAALATLSRALSPDIHATPQADSVAAPTDLDARVFKSFGLVLHALNALLVFALLRLLVGADLAAFAGALLFAIHPAQVEPVAWVTGLNNLLGGLWALLALLLFLRGISNETSDANSMNVSRFFVAATLCFGLSLLAKPTSVVLPLIAWLLAVLMLKQSPRRAARLLAFWALLSAAMIVITRLVQPAWTQTLATPLQSRPLLVLDSLAWYLCKIAWPAPLCIDYGRTPDIVLHPGLWSAARWLLPVGAAFGVWKFRGQRALLSGALIFLVAVLPMSGVVPYYFHKYSLVADRYLYLALLGPALMLAGLLAPLEKRGESLKLQIAAALGALIFALCSIGSARQVAVWNDSSTLFVHTLEINPRSWLALNNRGALLGVQGRLDEAVPCFQRALEIRPQDADTHANLGLALLLQGRSAAAKTELQEALRLDPNHVAARANLARLNGISNGASQ